MAYLLDTNIVVDLADGDENTLANVEALGAGVMMSMMTRIELEGGAYRDRVLVAARRHRLDRVLRSIPVLAFEEDSAETYGRVLAATGYSRRKVFDRMIAAQALVYRATLVTRNASDFSDIPGLQILEW